MSWKDLLQKPGETLVSPWLGGRALRLGAREWSIQGRLPPEPGWESFKLDGRKARWDGHTDRLPEALKHVLTGFLVGDRFVPDSAQIDPSPAKVVEHSEQVFLIEDGLGRFTRVSVGRMCEDGPLVFRSQEFPLGPEDAVQVAFEDQMESVAHIPNVPPALDAAFRMETWFRAEAEKRRKEAERRRLEEEAKRVAEERRQRIIEQLGDAQGRREMAAIDFAEAARAALAVGGALYLDHRVSNRRGEMVVRFRLDRHRYECTCDARTLQIMDAGICLTDHDTGEEGDRYFSLESLPSVIREADQKGKLVVQRHID